MKLNIYLLLAVSVVFSASGSASDSFTISAPDTTKANDFYVGNRPPLLPSPLVKLPVASIEPRGWIRTQLELQANGFHGHLTELSRFLEKQDNAWLSSAGEGSHGWEEVPYWLKGFTACAYILKDKRMIEEARVWIESTLRSQKEDGWFGPDKGRKGVAARNVGRSDLWPNMIMLFVLQTHYESTGDERVLDLMTNYFRWQMTVAEDDFLPPYWQQQRAADNLYSVYWLYNRTGEKWLLTLAQKVHRNTANWTDDVPNWHNVNFAQAFGGPATFWQQSKDAKYLEAAERNYQKVRSLYGQVPGGMFGSDENCRPGYNGPRQAIESCGAAEQMLSDETLLRITGNLIWADRCEDVAFNTFPATMTADLKALRYLTAPNQVLSDRHSKSPGVQNRGPMFLMDPHGHRCCQHNIGHAWPYFAENLWQATPGNGLAAVLYAPCQVTAKVGDGTEVSVTEETNYPFDETIVFTMATAKPVAFPLRLRVPSWCDAPRIQLNGKPLSGAAKPLSYVLVDREWHDGDRITLTLPMTVRVKRWGENKNSASVYRGPLCYSLKIGEDYRREGGTDEWPAWEIHPTTPWNYGLVLDEDDATAGFQVVQKPMPEGQPFVAAAAPIELTARAKRIPNWQLDELGLVGQMQQNPVKSDAPIEQIRLIPLGCARLRVSAFPVIGEGPDAREWSKPRASEYGPTASHCFHHDTVRALCDGLEPKNSNDHAIPRFTWWDHKGSEEWVQYTFTEPRKISRVEVYWFDDTGHGHCRVPQSWSIEYLDSKIWKPVKATSKFGTDPDKFNAVEFEPLSTQAVRLKAQLKPDSSSGILEWRVE